MMSFSALDFKTDALLRAALKRDKGLCGYHRGAACQHCCWMQNRILVLDDGELVGIGNHKELMKTCQVYGEIVSSQLSEEEISSYEQ